VYWKRVKNNLKSISSPNRAGPANPAHLTARPFTCARPQPTCQRPPSHRVAVAHLPGHHSAILPRLALLRPQMHRTNPVGIAPHQANPGTRTLPRMCRLPRRFFLASITTPVCHLTREPSSSTPPPRWPLPSGHFPLRSDNRRQDKVPPD
jgi:hypothetical protein